jgi:multiple sugar transport system ATP-binding protein
VALGRVLVREAQCNLYDEPLAHLDRPLVEQLQTCLLELHRKRPITTLFVTHDQQEALALGQRVVVLAAGRIQQVAPPREIYDCPANRFVAGFFGSPSMNFLSGRLIAKDGRMRFETGAIQFPIDHAQAQMLRDRADAKIVVGLRPEAICPLNSIAGPAHNEIGAFDGTVHASEFHGDRMFHRIETTDGHLLIVRGATRESLRLRTTVRFRIDTNQLHFFQEGEFGARI